MKNLNSRPFIGILLVLIPWILWACTPSDPITPTSAPQIERTLLTDAGDGYWPTQAWRVSDPADQGMDPEMLEKMVEKLGGLGIDSLVVVRNGYIVMEKYYAPYDQDTLHGVYSVTKSILSALIGIAIREGYIHNVDDPVLDYFSGRTFENDDDRKQTITLEHLLTMSAGLDWNWDEMIYSPDYVQYVLDQPLLTEPGTAFLYSSGNSQVLSAILQESSGLTAQEFAREYLFNHLGIEELSWNSDLTGISLGGWGLKLKPRDMAKIGYLYLNEGGWDGQQVIPAAWVEASTRSYIRVPEPLEPWEVFMGYSWWVHEDGIYAAHGTKGQFIYVIPELDLVVVITGHLPDAQFTQPQRLIREYIIPAVITDTN